MDEKRRLKHFQVRHVTFCPNETYCLTWNGALPQEKHPEAYHLWDVATGESLRHFSTPLFNASGSPEGTDHLVFSPDSKFILRLSEKSAEPGSIPKDIQIYTLPDFKLYQRPGEEGPEPLHFDNGVEQFQFSPVDNILAVWSPQVGEAPASLSLLDVTTGEKLQSRGRVDHNAQIRWHPTGDFLALMLAKKPKNPTNNRVQPFLCKTIEISRMRQKGIPTEKITTDGFTKGVFWEPKSSRLGLLVEGSSSSKTMMLFYNLADDKCVEVAKFELPSGAFSQIHWAPEGQYFVVAAPGAGDLLWGRLHSDTHTFEPLFKDEHYNMNHVEWDASGRYLITAVMEKLDGTSGASVSQDAGFTVWTFQGRPVHRESIEKLHLASWRPHPALSLTKEEQDQLRRDFKKHSRGYDRVDEEAKDRNRRELKAQKHESMNHFKGLIEKMQQHFREQAAKEGLDWFDDLDAFNEAHRFEERHEEVETIIETREESY